MYKSIGNSLISCIFRCKISKNCWNCAVMEQLVTTKCHEWNSKAVRYPRGTLPGIVAILGMDFNVAVANVSLENAFYATFFAFCLKNNLHFGILCLNLAFTFIILRSCLNFIQK